MADETRDKIDGCVQVLEGSAQWIFGQDTALNEIEEYIEKEFGDSKKQSPVHEILQEVKRRKSICNQTHNRLKDALSILDGREDV